MDLIHELLKQETWRIIDQTTYGHTFDALQSFAMDDTICQTVAKGEVPPTLRSWVHENTIVLGIQDSKLPFISKAVSFLNNKAYRIIVRNSGGLAVVLDRGILNLSLILSEKENKIDINNGYDAMYKLIKILLSPYNVKIAAKEIKGSYCPGNYDLSINNQKFAGISQRRVRGGVAVQIYLCVTGSGSNRASLIKEFYSIATGHSNDISAGIPHIRPETMASLSELLGEPITHQQLLEKLYLLLQNSSKHIIQSQLSVSEINLFNNNYQKVTERNRKALGE
jgi:octanoyl-[GcvH]:protein N-octanoyltransferase